MTLRHPSMKVVRLVGALVALGIFLSASPIAAAGQSVQLATQVQEQVSSFYFQTFKYFRCNLDCSQIELSQLRSNYKVFVQVKSRDPEAHERAQSLVKFLDAYQVHALGGKIRFDEVPDPDSAEVVFNIIDLPVGGVDVLGDCQRGTSLRNGKIIGGSFDIPMKHIGNVGVTGVKRSGRDAVFLYCLVRAINSLVDFPERQTVWQSNDLFGNDFTRTYWQAIWPLRFRSGLSIGTVARAIKEAFSDIN